MAEPRRKATPAQETRNDDPQIELGLNAAIVTVREGQPYILVTRPGTAGSEAWDALPFGPFAPRAHRTLEIGLREWVKRQTGLALGYVEQLYTFGDRGRHAEPGGAHTLSVGYLALTRGAGDELLGSHWSPWYAYFPWEDWRRGKPAYLTEQVEPRLQAWARLTPAHCEASAPPDRLDRRQRLRMAFGCDGGAWDEEKALERYELLYEAGLAPEASRDRKQKTQANLAGALGEPMLSDHRRILATAIGRLRGKIKYRPVVFELMPERFTLLDLQKVVEALLGLPLHKQNFRRLLDRTGLVEGAGEFDASAGGRPAELFRARRETYSRASVTPHRPRGLRRGRRRSGAQTRMSHGRSAGLKPGTASRRSASIDTRSPRRAAWPNWSMSLSRTSPRSSSCPTTSRTSG